MIWAGHLIPKHGSKAATTFFAISCCFGLLLVALAPGVATAAVAMYIFGGTFGATDVSMNANAVTVEKRIGRSHHVIFARILEPRRLRRRRHAAAS